MINPSRLNELGKTLSRRFFAGEAILVLSKIKKQFLLSSDDERFLKEIKNFFENAMTALDMTYKEFVVSEVFVQNTLALYELSLAIERWKPSANFTETAHKLMSIAARLSPLQSISVRDLGLLIDFFTRLDRYYAERSADLLE